MTANLTGTQYKKTRERGNAPWSPGPRLAAVLADVESILDELVPEFGPQGNRGIAYRLTDSDRYEKGDRLFTDVDQVSNRGRRGGHIPWAAINDPGFRVVGDDGYDDLYGFHDHIRRLTTNYRRDRQQGQPIHKVLWVEAAGLVSMVNHFAMPFGVPVVSGGGTDSTTGKREMALDIAVRRGTTVVGVITDHDPHGLMIADSRTEDVTTFVNEFRNEWTINGAPMTGDVEWKWLAVRPDQIDSLGLTSKPHPTGKQTVGNNADARLRTVQAEAVHPRDLRRIVRDFIARDFDHRAWWVVKRQEREERRRAVAVMDALDLGEA